MFTSFDFEAFSVVGGQEGEWWNFTFMLCCFGTPFGTLFAICLPILYCRVEECSIKPWLLLFCCFG